EPFANVLKVNHGFSPSCVSFSPVRAKTFPFRVGCLPFQRPVRRSATRTGSCRWWSCESWNAGGNGFGGCVGAAPIAAGLAAVRAVAAFGGGGRRDQQREGGVWRQVPASCR